MTQLTARIRELEAEVRDRKFEAEQLRKQLSESSKYGDELRINIER
jgi:hypothetical protein